MRGFQGMQLLLMTISNPDFHSVLNQGLPVLFAEHNCFPARTVQGKGCWAEMHYERTQGCLFTQPENKPAAGRRGKTFFQV